MKKLPLHHSGKFLILLIIEAVLTKHLFEKKIFIFMSHITKIKSLQIANVNMNITIKFFNTNSHDLGVGINS